MKTESSSKDRGAEGGSATCMPTMHSQLIPLVGYTHPLTSASFSERRSGAAETAETQALETPLSWAGSHLALGKDIFLFPDWPSGFQDFLFDLGGMQDPESAFLCSQSLSCAPGVKSWTSWRVQDSGSVRKIESSDPTERWTKGLIVFRKRKAKAPQRTKSSPSLIIREANKNYTETIISHLLDCQRSESLAYPLMA